MVDPATGWIAAHALASLLTLMRRRFPPLGSVVVLALVGWSLIAKPPSYDLIRYLEFFSEAQHRDDFEIGFRLISSLSSRLLGGDAFLVYTLFVLASVYGLLRIHLTVAGDRIGIKPSIIGCTAAIVLSVFFLMGAQNVLRQYLSLILLGLAFVCYYRSRIFLSIFLCIGALSFHQSAILFATVMLFVLVALKRGRVFAIAGSFILSFVALGSISLIQPDHDFFTEGFAWGEERSSTAVKFFVYFLTLLITHLSLIKSALNQAHEYQVVFLMRWVCLVIALPAVLFGYDDLFSRLIFPLFIFDFLVLSAALSGRSDRFVRFSAAILLAAYAVAPNVLNVYRGVG